MPTTQVTRAASARRIVIAVLILAAVAGLIVGVLHFTIPLRAAVPPPVATGFAIFVSPHPDDETYSMGQTIATQELEGVPTLAVLVTDGDSSVFVDWWAQEHGRDIDEDGDVDRWDFGLARREEYAAALELLGVDEIVYLGGADSQGREGFLDTEVEAGALEEALVELGHVTDGAAWFTTAPYEGVLARYTRGDYKNHPDHGQVAKAVAGIAARQEAPAYFFKVYAYYLSPFARFAPKRIEGSDEARAMKRAAVDAFGVIGAKSTPELFAATPLDEAEYLVPAPESPE